MPNRLSVEDLTVCITASGHLHTLVDDVSLTLERGRILSLVGASGCGKSITCAAILNALPPGPVQTRGRVLIDGYVEAPDRLRGRQIATIMQNPRSAFNPVHDMRHHAYETLRAVGKLGRDADDRIGSCMVEVGLVDARRTLGLYPFEMSGGMLQRMMIALALLSEAPFLFADEPTSDLDLVVQMRILDLLERLVEEHGLGVLLVTHDMGVVARLAHEVAVMDQGNIIETVGVQEVFHAPRHPVTRMLVEAHLSLYGMELAP